MKFLSLEKEAFGLDISDMSLKMVSLRPKGKSFVLESLNQVELEPGIIEKGVIQDENTLAKIIRTLYSNPRGKKVQTRYVAASLPEERSFLQVIQMPQMKTEELQSAVIFEAENYIPLPINEVYLDYQIISPIKDRFNHLDVLIVATPKKIVNSYVSCLKKAGLVPLILEVESQAIARAMIENEISNAPLVLIDFGKTSTIFTIFSGHSIHFTCSIPVSADQFTEAIAKSFEVDWEKAEKLKIKHVNVDGTKDHIPEKMLQATNVVLNELIAQIKKYLNFYQSHTSHEHLQTPEKIKKIILCGGGANLQGLPEFLSTTLQIPVELGNFWVNLPAMKNANKTQGNPLSFTTALGLALRGTDTAKNI